MTTLASVPTALRSTRAVFAGVLFVVVVSTVIDMLMHATGVYPPMGQVMPDPLFLLPLAYRMVVAAVGGWITARLAPSSPIRHALVLGVTGTVAGVLGVLATQDGGPELGPRWYAIAVAATALPMAWLGARLAKPRA